VKLRYLMAIVMAPALLAGCGGGSDDDDRTASGQILEGSASDAMIPLERATSQPPLARDRAVADGEAEAEEGAPDEAATDEGPGENPLLTGDGTSP